LSLSNTALGLLVGLYLLPGIALALPGGWLHDATGSPAAPVWFAGLALALALVPLAIFRTLQRRAMALP